MKKRRLLVLLFAAASVLPITAAPVACPSTGSLATLVTLNASGGCLINGLLFENFVVTPSATGTGQLPTAAQVTYTLDNPGTSTGTGQSIYGFEFNPNLSVVGIGSEDILLNYTILAPTAEMTSLHLLENALNTVGASATVSEGPDRGCTGVGTGCTFLPILTATTASPHQDMLGIGPYTQIDVSKDINVTGTTAGASASISQVRDAVDLNYIPEPATFAFVGGGLLFLGLVKRKRA